MNNLLKPVLDLISKLWAYVLRLPKVRWGTVTQTTPLLVHLDDNFDADDNPVTVAPQTVVQTIPVGRRVVCVEQDNRVIVIAVAEI